MLHQVGVTAGTGEVATDRAHDALRDGVGERRERRSDRQHGLSRSEQIAVAEWHDTGQLTLDLHDGQIADGIATDQRGGALSSVCEYHQKRIAIGDDVVVRDDVPRGSDDETGARSHRLRDRSVGALLVDDLVDHRHDRRRDQFDHVDRRSFFAHERGRHRVLRERGNRSNNRHNNQRADQSAPGDSKLCSGFTIHAKRGLS